MNVYRTIGIASAFPIPLMMRLHPFGGVRAVGEEDEGGRGRGDPTHLLPHPGREIEISEAFTDHQGILFVPPEALVVDLLGRVDEGARPVFPPSRRFDQADADHPVRGRDRSSLTEDRPEVSGRLRGGSGRQRSLYDMPGR